MVSLLYIFSRHYSVLRNRALPAVIEQISENWFWPGPLRRRKTRRKVFNGCRDTFCAAVGLVVLFLLCSNSAAPPSPVADKWFAASPQSRLEPAADKQAGSTQLMHQQPAHQLQLGTFLAIYDEDVSATSPMLSFAESCILQMCKIVKQQSQPNAAAITPTAADLATPGGIIPGPPTRLTASAARMPEPSRALMLVPRLPVCPAVFPSSALIVKPQHTLTIYPHRPMLKFLSQASAHMEDWYSIIAPAAADIAVVPSLPDLACNDTLMCCMVDSLAQPKLTLITAHAPRTFAASSSGPSHTAAGSPYAHFLPDLRSWSWLQTLIIGAFMFSLGFIIPGTCFLRYLYGELLHLCECAAAC